MLIETKYNLGDKVWPVRTANMLKRIECLTCDQTGSITIKGEKLICPKCQGKANHEVYAGHKYYVCKDEASKVGQIKVEITVPKFLHSSTNVEYQNENRYMIEMTGVCGGQVWRESELFPNKEEAQAYCDKMNGDKFGKEHYVEPKI